MSVIGINYCIAQPRAHVDERFELTGVVFSLSDEEVYHYQHSDYYWKDIETYFSKYRNHELIKFINEKFNDNFHMDFPCTLAADIEITSEGIVWTHRWIPYYENYKLYTDAITWTKTEMDEYLRLLNNFYKDTKFHDFFISHKDFYSKVENSFQKLVDQVDTAWFTDFFGKPYSMENIWIVPAFEGNNFGFRRKDTSGKEYNNCIMGCSRIDETGTPFFKTNDFKVLIHESCHNYTEPMWEKYYGQCEGICDTIFSYLKNVLTENHYGSASSTIFEGMNILYEHCYYKDHNTLENEFVSFECSMKNAAFKGFPWMSEAMTFMDNFYNNRDVYIYCEYFISDLINFLHNIADNMKEYYYPKMYEFSPLIINTFPAKNSVIDTNVKTMMFKLSQPIEGVFSFNDLNGNLSLNDVEVKMADAYTGVVTLKKKLKPHTQYKIVIYVITEPCHCTNSYYELIFDTK